MRVRYTPHQYQSMIMVTVTIETEAVETSCRILGGDYFYITNEKSFMIEALIVGDDSEIDSYSY